MNSHPSTFNELVPEPKEPSPWTQIIPAGLDGDAAVKWLLEYIVAALRERAADHPTPRLTAWGRACDVQNSLRRNPKARTDLAGPNTSGEDLVRAEDTRVSIYAVLRALRPAIASVSPEAAPADAAEYVYSCLLWDGSENQAPGAGPRLIELAWAEVEAGPGARAEIERRAQEREGDVLSRRALQVQAGILCLRNYLVHHQMSGPFDQIKPRADEAFSRLEEWFARDRLNTREFSESLQRHVTVGEHAIQELLPHLQDRFGERNPYAVLADALDGTLEDIPEAVLKVVRAEDRRPRGEFSYRQEIGYDRADATEDDLEMRRLREELTEAQLALVRTRYRTLSPVDQEILRLSLDLDGAGEHELHEINETLGLGYRSLSGLWKHIKKVLRQLGVDLPREDGEGR